MALTGYPPRDLLLYERFVDRVRDRADELAKALADGPPLLLGAVERNRTGQGKPVFNCALFCEGGEVTRSVRKTLLPTYDVFDEARYFEPAPEGDPEANIIRTNGLTLAVTICEDAWNDKDYWDTRTYARDPLEEAAAQHPDIIINLSASPLFLGKQRLREDMLGAVARKYGAPMVYVNQAGADDDLVFDGRSCAFTSDGGLMARAKGFEEDVIVVLARPGRRHPRLRAQKRLLQGPGRPVRGHRLGRDRRCGRRGAGRGQRDLRAHALALFEQRFHRRLPGAGEKPRGQDSDPAH